MTTEQRDRLRALAEAATPGPWRWVGGSLFGKDDPANGDPNYVLGCETEYDEDSGESWGQLTFNDKREEEDTEFIAASDPQTVLSLLDALEETEKALEQAIELAGIDRDEHGLLNRDLVVCALVEGREELAAHLAKRADK